MRLRSLHVRESAHGATELLLEAQLRDRDLARRLVELEVGERTVRDPVRLDAHAEPLEFGDLVPVHRRIEDAVRREMLLVWQRLPVADVRDRDELHRRIPVPVQHRRRVEQVVAVPVVERDQHGARGQRLELDVVSEDGVEVDDRVAELLELRHQLVEEPGRHRHPVVRDVVDLVEHQHAERAAVAVHRTDAVRRLADRAIDGVLQDLLELLAHAIRLLSFAAYSEGVTPHSSPVRRAAAPSRSARSRSDNTRTSASARPSASSGSTRKPLTPSSTTSGMPARLPPMIARPRAAASSATRGSPSERDGRQKTQASSIAAATSSAASRFDHSTPGGTSVRSVPSPTTCRLAPGTRGAARLQASTSVSKAL